MRMEAKVTGRRARDTVLWPCESQTFEGLEYSVHVPAASVRRELKTVFPEAGAEAERILMVPTVQRARCSLLTWGAEQAAEKDRLLERFVSWCEAVRSAVRQVGDGDGGGDGGGDAWMDAAEPASGAALWGARGGVYGEVDGFARALAYDVQQVGACGVLAHPRWRFHSYPATLFCAAPRQTLLRALHHVNGAPSSNAQLSSQ